MRDLGELMFYIEILNFDTRKELQEKLQDMLIKSNDSELMNNIEMPVIKNSLEKALSILESTTEQEIQEIKRVLNDK